MSDPLQPLIVCMENMDGEKVSLRINPTDTFQIFLDNAKELLGYDIDLDSVTGNRPVALDDNIYTFLINVEDSINNPNYNDQNYNQNTELINFHEQEYVLDDGTQIKASQIEFDNDDPIIDLSAEKIPFVKYIDDGASEDESKIAENFIVKDYNIPKSPELQQATRTSSPRGDFANSLPFKLFCKNISNIEAQFTKYLELTSSSSTNLNLSDKNNYDEDFNYDITMKNRNECLTREDVLNMFKDSPVTSLPYDENKSFDKRKHARKTDPSRLVHKNSNYKAETEANKLKNDQGCCICDKVVDGKVEKSYIFDKEDQMIHRCERKETKTQLKIICTHCLNNHFQPSLMKSPSQSLNTDEYLVIQNNQQFIFEKITPIILKKSSVDLETIISNGKNKVNAEFFKVEIGPDGEIITKPIDNDDRSDDVVFIEDKVKECSSDIEIIEADQNCEDVDNIDEETLKEFLGKYESNNNENVELKCRFCERIFENVCQVTEHAEEHKHDLDDGPIYPCPLCDYGYAEYKWLKGHLKAAHDRVEKENENQDEVKGKEIPSRDPSPVARRTRSSVKKNDSELEKGNKENQETEAKANETVKSPPTFITEVKQECLDSSDEEAIWILQAENDVTQQIEHLLQKKVNEKNENGEEVHKCFNCKETVSSAEALAAHKCKKRGRKRKCLSKDSKVLAPSQEHCVKNAQRKPRQLKKTNNKESVKLRKKKDKGSCDSQIVTCHNCNESFTSKVRLKFHMQFHETSTMLTSDGAYVCFECDGTIFPTETELFDHIHFQHDKQKRWQCPVKDCGKTFFLRATLTKHSRIHTDTRRYVCVTCGKRFLDKQTLDEHGVTHLQIKPFECHICLKQLTRRSRLRMHLRAHEEELQHALVLVCAVCCRAFRDHQDAQEHITRSTECLEVFTSELKEDTETERLSPTTGIVRQKTETEGSKLSKPIEREVNTKEAAALLATVGDAARSIIRVVNIEKAFRCEYCEDVFYVGEALNKHRNIHMGVKNPFTCHICRVSFATYSRCTTHKTTHGFYKRTAEAKGGAPHDGAANAGILGYGGFPVVKHFLCEDCGRSYLHWTYLQVHRRMKHASEQLLYKCNHCDLTFPNSWSIAYHRKKVHGKSGGDDGVTKIIREDYKIPCRDCDEVLPNKTALYKHRQKEHSEQATDNEDNISECAKETTCTKCGTDLETFDALQKHLREAHGADENKGSVGRRFRSAAVREHPQGHSGDRPYSCDLCGVAFRRATAMRNHRLIHTGVRSWVCPRCPKRFRVRSDLRAHLRLKHPSRLAVIEIVGLSPTREEVLNYLKMNNIHQHKILEISMISFAKGTTDIVPNSARALSMLSGVQKTHIPYENPASQPPDMFQPTRRDLGIPKGPTRPSILQQGTELSQGYFPLAMNYSESLSAYNVELLLQEGGLVNGNQMVQLQLDDEIK